MVLAQLCPMCLCFANVYFFISMSDAHVGFMCGFCVWLCAYSAILRFNVLYLFYRTCFRAAINHTLRIYPTKTQFYHVWHPVGFVFGNQQKKNNSSKAAPQQNGCYMDGLIQVNKTVKYKVSYIWTESMRYMFKWCFNVADDYIVFVVISHKEEVNEIIVDV